MSHDFTQKRSQFLQVQTAHFGTSQCFKASGNCSNLMRHIAKPYKASGDRAPNGASISSKDWGAWNWKEIPQITPVFNETTYHRIAVKNESKQQTPSTKKSTSTINTTYQPTFFPNLLCSWRLGIARRQA